MRFEDLTDYLRLRRVTENPLEIVRFRKNRRLGDELCVRFRDRPALFLRAGRADYHMFHRIFLRDEYHLDSRLEQGFGTVVDLGGNVGVFSSRVAPYSRKVVTCEPVPENCERLAKNLSGFANVIRRNVAISDQQKTIRIFLPREDKTSGVYSSYLAGHEHLLTPDFLEVPAIGLAQLLGEHDIDVVDLLKIDVEGAEYNILYPAAELLPRIRRIHGEFHDVERDDPRTRIENFVKWLQAHGYRVEVEHHARTPNHGMFFAVRVD